MTQADRLESLVSETLRCLPITDEKDQKEYLLDLFRQRVGVPYWQLEAPYVFIKADDIESITTSGSQVMVWLSNGIKLWLDAEAIKQIAAEMPGNEREAVK